MINDQPAKPNARKWIILISAAALLVAILSFGIFANGRGLSIGNLFGKSELEPVFDAQRAFQDVEYQVALGPRIPGSEAHQNIQSWMLQELEKAGWESEVQNATIEGQQVANIIAKLGEGDPWFIIGAHYDTRIYANLDPDISKVFDPVPGANDGGSGVAVLLELARQLPAYFETESGTGPQVDGSIWLVFFDAEDNGQIAGWDWILGSRAFVAQLQGKPQAAVIVDMVGDKNLKIYQEENSDDRLNQEIWETAADLGYTDYFLPYEKYAILDDHIPFIEAGIPAADIIDFEYAYWHTTADTPDKVSAESLEIVGKTVLAWLLNQFR